MDKDIVEQNNEIISVGELNRSAKYLLESNFPAVSVIGEISNLARPASGHIYFSLKDDEGSIQCAMFKGSNMGLNFNPKDGDECIVSGNISLFVQRGNYQLIAKKMILAGQGNLMQEFEKLKSKLKDEGLFDDANKLPIPEAPKHVAVITSTSTAALQDILSTIERRAPSMKISVSPATVQGENASETIIEAFKRIQNYNNNSSDKIDCVLLCRGGGSIEDLWCFNNEDLAREIFNFEIPIISGVGHEIDFTIADFVSDLRAPTPTAAAEIVSEFNFNLIEKLSEISKDLVSSIKNILRDKNQTLDYQSSHLKHPAHAIREQYRVLTSAYEKIRILVKQKILDSKLSFKENTNSLMIENPKYLILDNKNSLQKNHQSLKTFIQTFLSKSQSRLVTYEKVIKSIDPQNVLDRGYSLITNTKGDVIKDSAQINEGDEITAKLAKGSFEAKVRKNNV
jgi:exodeoxyribonuclease VII large subunit